MSIAGLALIAAGAVLLILGLGRARGPWARYQAMREQDANIARYEAWRGGLRDSGTTGASVAMAVLRRQARNGAIIAAAGAALVIAGLVVG